MKRYRITRGDLLIIREDPTGDLVSLTELKETIEIIGSLSDDLGEIANGILEELKSL